MASRTPLSSGAGGRSAEAHVRLDHVLVGVADLEVGRAEIERLTGVRPDAGGSHPRWGSHNALLALGPRSYLELVALRPEAPATGPFESLRGLARPTPVGWALATEDLEVVRQRLQARGLAVTEIVPGARDRPDGSRLEWRMMGFAERSLLGVWPFFIEWGEGCAHPAKDAPAGCRLRSLSVTAPRTERLAGLCEEFMLGVELTTGRESGLSIELETPEGPVSLGG